MEDDDVPTRSAGAASASPVVLLEGQSDAAVVRALLAARGRDGVELAVMDGITNLGRFLEEYDGRRLLALFDAAERRVVDNLLARRATSTRPVGELADGSVFWCQRDLEDELIRWLGPPVVQEELEALGELRSFRTLQQMPYWRDQPVADQLHRFAGSGAGRKLRLATRLAGRLDPENLPPPLAGLVDAVGDGGQPATASDSTPTTLNTRKP